MRKKAARPASAAPEEAPFLPMTSPVGDARKLRRHATASADELRAFLAELRGKSPREMLGEVANSDLGRSLVTATAGALILIVTFTVIPFGWSMVTSDPTPPPPSVTEVPPSPADSPAATTPTEPANPLATEAAAESLGIGESKPAPPAVNPLDAANDDLLEGLD